MTKQGALTSGIDRAQQSMRAEREILLTGVPGFVGKVILEALLARAEALGVRRVHVLVRPKYSLDAAQRFANEVERSRCFENLAAGWADRVSVVSGDLAEDGCGIDGESTASLTERITHVIHCAASVIFDQPLEHAALDNITSSLNLLELAKSFRRLESMVSLSTAYVTPHPQATKNALDPPAERSISEELVPLPYPAMGIYNAIRAGEVDESQLLRETGHPNTYTLSKCIAEHLLAECKGKISLTLLRPSIVSAAWRQPFPGWIDSHAAFAAFVMLIGAGQLRAIAADRSARIDVVPCDEVARQAIDACLENPAPAEGPPAIRHVVAGAEHAVRVDRCSEAITEYYKNHRIGAGPHLRYIGPIGPSFRLQEWIHHRARLAVASAFFKLTRRHSKSRSLSGLSERLTYINRVFPYFTHNTFDFRASVPLQDPDFDAVDYVETVCAGLHTLTKQGSLTRKRRSTTQQTS